ncbi:CBM96 family carbohydrate-binding protein [Dyadobacter sandarakinus]|uniref:DNRLRE domain-containing protein n=1 Tax=Dyadobacter sandarakinus TaxID=2747268 RepID=A0ABX7I6C6_9BACT|nr:DNRLRE domain-containing protein [Dyadobacter sandarakinus]QRR01440.1 DNRLRE domain-containing protein [Dyadobacter sandarakinus]
MESMLPTFFCRAKRIFRRLVLTTGSSNGGSDFKTRLNSKFAGPWLMIFLFIAANLSAQPALMWNKTFGGNNRDVLRQMEQTTDGGYILGGTTESDISGDKTQASKGSADFWVVKVSANGTKEWDKTFGGSGFDELIAVHQTRDGGYILGGRSDSNAGGDKSSNDRRLTAGGRGDYWIVKISATGIKQWDKTIGGTGSDYLTSVRQTPDNGYLLAGFSESGVGGEKSQPALETTFPRDNWLVKISETGNKVWDRTFGTTYQDAMLSMDVTEDGGCLVSGNVIGQETNLQWYLAKFSPTGTRLWEKLISTNGNDLLQEAHMTSDGGYILGASAQRPHNDYIVAKLNTNAEVVWNKAFSGLATDFSTSIDILASVIQTKDGGYLVGGYSSGDAGSAKSEDSKGLDDYWVIKLYPDGTKQWDKSVGGTSYDYLASVIQTKDDGYALGGYSTSPAGKDKTEGSRGGFDMWITKLAPESNNKYLIFSSGTLNFRLENGTSKASKTVMLAASADSTAVTFTKSANSNWLTLPAAALGQLTFGINAAGLSPGSYTAKVTASAPGYRNAILMVELTVKPVNTGTTVRINAGGAAFTTVGGKLFSADRYFSGIDRIHTIPAGDILKTEDDALYRSERSATSFSYNIPVKNGEYVVVLHFAEIYFGAPGGPKASPRQRLFNIDIEGLNRASEYNISAYAGGPMRAVQEEYTQVVVSDGLLNIDFLNAGANLPSVAAIEVVPASEYISTIVLSPLADVHVRDSELAAQNFGASELLEVKSANGNGNRNTYLQFSVTGLYEPKLIISAKLRVYGYNVENNTNVNVSAYGIDNDEWTESGINWQNAPMAGLIPEGYTNVNAENKYYEIDVTNYVRAQVGDDGFVSLMLKNPTLRNRKLYFHSKENPSGNAPQLVILTNGAYTTPNRMNMERTNPATTLKQENKKSIIYPNPVKKQLVLTLSDKHQGAVRLQLINGLGTAYELAAPRVNEGKVEVDISGLPLSKGIYLLKVGSATATEVLKVLVTQ